MILDKIKFYLPLYLGVLPMQLFGFYALLTYNFNYLWFTIAGYICIMLLGVAACYHRMLCHKAYETSRFIKLLTMWFAAISCQGSPISWVTVHRGYHHRYADADRDPHSPNHGFWHSYMGWMFKLRFGSMNPKYIPDLLRDKDCLFFHKYYNEILFSSHLIIALISFDFWLFAVLLPAFITLHSYCINTSINHYTTVGYKNYETKDNGLNVVWLFPIILGEAWHNNHHGAAKNANFGLKIWEFDPTYWLIKLIRKNP